MEILAAAALLYDVAEGITIVMRIPELEVTDFTTVRGSFGTDLFEHDLITSVVAVALAAFVRDIVSSRRPAGLPRPRAATFTLPTMDHCYFFSRLIIANGSPFCIQKVHVPYALLPDAVPAEEIRSVSPYCYLESFCGTKIKRIREMADVVSAAGEDADLLELTPGTFVLRQHHVCYANGDMPMSFSETLFRTDGKPRTVEFERLRF